MSAASVRCYRVEHRTTYRYSEPVTLSHQQLHLTPRQLAYQRSRTHEVTITPAPTYRRERTDAFGNPVTEIAIESAHSTLEIVGRSNVEVGGRELPEADKTAAWETVREALAYRAGWRPDPLALEATEFLFESPHARVKRDLRAYASDCFRPGRSVLEAAQALMGKIHAEFKFDAEATTTTTPVMTFFKQKRGVCQDFTHFMISCLRSTGLAARYVSGYLVNAASAGQTTARGRGGLPCVGGTVRARQRLDRARSDQQRAAFLGAYYAWVGPRFFRCHAVARCYQRRRGADPYGQGDGGSEMIERVGMMERWNNGIVEKWNQDKGSNVFHHSNIPAFHFSIARLLLRQAS